MCKFDARVVGALRDDRTVRPVLCAKRHLGGKTGRASTVLKRNCTAWEPNTIAPRQFVRLLALPRAFVAFAAVRFRCSDLVGMYAHENVVNLTRYALPLEEFVRRQEEESARLEATLLPQYRANGECVSAPVLVLSAFGTRIIASVVAAFARIGTYAVLFGRDVGR